MTRRFLGAIVLTVGFLLAGIAPAAAAPGPCIRVGQVCYASVQDAVDAAHNGDTVRIPAGQFPGGVVVTRSINLVGAGAGATALVGGEHVLTVGTWMARRAPTVTIHGLTLRGGRAHSSPESIDFTGLAGAIAGGAGLEIPASESGPGATVTVIDTVITGNRSTPVESLLPTPEQEPDWPHCPDGFCTFAPAFGGGVENWGDLTLIRSTVSGNLAGGPLASDVDGAGIYSWGDLTMRSSTIRGNRAAAVAPHGRFAEGGGIFMANETALSIRTSSVIDNTASLSSTNPVTNPDGSTTEMLVNAGGVHVNDGSTVAIDASRIDDNAAVVHNPQGQAAAINAGLQLTFSDLTMTNTSVSGNRAVARIHTVGDFGPMGSALQWCNLATISGLRANGNTTAITALGGDAVASAAVFAGATSCNGFDPGPSTLSHSRIQGNTATTVAPHGRADVLGAGIDVDASLTMAEVLVSGNRGVGRGDSGDVRGGGIWNGPFFPENEASNLTLDHDLIVGNSVTGSPGVTATGGGIYTQDPIAFHATVVRGNRPNQCTGCASGVTAAATALGTVSRPVATNRRAATDPLVARLAATHR